MPVHSPKIILLINSLGTGGAEKQLVYLALALKKLDYDIQVFTLITEDMNPGYQKQLTDAHIPLKSFDAIPGDLNPLILLNVMIAIRHTKADIVHSFLFHSNLVARLARLINPHIIQISSIRSLIEGGRKRDRLYRLTDPLCHITTQNSQPGAARYIQTKSVPAHKMRIIPNGIDTKHFSPQPHHRTKLRHELDLGENLTWLSVGRLERVKNYPLLLHTFHRIIKQYPQTRLLIAGDGPLRSELENLLIVLDLTTTVQLLGVRRDINEVMNAADACVLSSLWEGTPNVLLEAGATGLPVVACDVGGVADTMMNGVTGFLAEPENEQDLLETMIQIMDMSDAQRQQVGCAGRAYIVEHYSLENSIKHWIEVYQETLAHRGNL